MTDDERPRDAASLARFMAAMDAYRDKAVYNSLDDASPPGDGDGPFKALVVDHAIGERVRLRGGDDDEWGFVTGLVVRPGSIAYQVSWPESKAVTEHYGLELEDAD